MSELGDAAALDTRRREQFVAVAQAGTLAAAAEQMFLTQQALSTALRQLEREVGVTLFDRSGRRLVLTAAGEDLLEGALPLLAGARELARSVRRRAAGVPDAFTIGHSPALSGDEVFALVEPALELHPDVSVTLIKTFPDRFTDQLLSGEIDLVMRRGVETPPQLTSSIVTYHPLRLAMAADHRLADADTISVRDLLDVPIVVWAPERQSFYTDFLVAHLRRGGVEPTLCVCRVQGAPPATAVLVDNSAVAFVTDPAGTSHESRVIVKDFDYPPLTPVQALWLPHTVSAFRSSLLNSAPGQTPE
ncbi:LysR family transcriptional regulator [Gordonia sputi]|uniref:Putative LysR family transcriptional regulator n=1 Tax=Gordonia sputi NBRC 100414 TaxID=1089453 RepID=H5TZM8_9ACTN|nr:LysR family transcriptional regulator [Gordonia sputi]NKY93750.1 LysR family transcriptional regulator [Gordonia sputi]GAB38936.1 putative LysR family transcriptional regulator [Gordonia sputi NBRC 100414]